MSFSTQHVLLSRRQPPTPLRDVVVVRMGLQAARHRPSGGSLYRAIDRPRAIELVLCGARRPAGQPTRLQPSHDAHRPPPSRLPRPLSPSLRVDSRTRLGSSSAPTAIPCLPARPPQRPAIPTANGPPSRPHACSTSPSLRAPSPAPPSPPAAPALVAAAPLPKTLVGIPSARAAPRLSFGLAVASYRSSRPPCCESSPRRARLLSPPPPLPRTSLTSRTSLPPAISRPTSFRFVSRAQRALCVAT